MLALLCLSLCTAGLTGAVGPAAPANTDDGDYVDIDGVLYQQHEGRLYTLDDPILDENMSVTELTGSHLDTNRKQRIIRTETITGDDIRELGARTLADVLEEQGGVQVNSNLGLGSEVFVDGLDGRHVLILVDGRPVNGKVNNRVDVSRLPVSADSIERIEIVRGPMSALYGSEALGGVINIITKKPTSRSADGRGGNGGDGDGDGDLKAGGGAELFGQVVPGGRPWFGAGLHGHGGLGPLALRLDINLQDMPGYDRGGRTSGATTPDGKSDVPDRRQGSFSVDATVTPNNDWNVRSALQWTGSQSSAAIAAGAPFRDIADNNEVAWSLTASGVRDIGLVRPLNLSADIRLDRFTHQFSKQPRGDADVAPTFCGGVLDAPCPVAPQLRTDATKDEARLEFRGDTVFVDDPDISTALGRELSASVGAVLLQEHATRVNDDGEDTLPGGGDRTTVSTYGEVLWRPFSFLSVLPGARLDAFLVDGTSAGTEANADTSAFGPKLATRLDLPAGFSVRASAGRGFRLPSFEERFLRFDHSELGYIVQGNAALTPEQSTGLRSEINFTMPDAWSTIIVDGGVELSANFLDGLISEQASGEDIGGIPVFTYGNSAHAFTSALTTRLRLARIPLGRTALLSFVGSWQYLLAANDTAGCPPGNPWFCGADEGARALPLRPTHAVDLTLRTLLRATDTTVFTRFDLLSERPLINDIAPGSMVVSAGIRQPVVIGGANGEVLVGLENLLDQTDPVFGPKPGRHATFQLRVWH